MSATMETGKGVWKPGKPIPIDPFSPRRQADADARARAEQYYARIQRIEKEHRYLTADYWNLGKALLELMAQGTDPYTLGYERHRLDRAIRIKERFVVPEDCAEMPVDEAAFGKRSDPPLENPPGSAPSIPVSEEGSADDPLDDDGDDTLAATSSHAGSKAADLQNTETPPSLCQWICERLVAAGVNPGTILDPCAGRGNLTRPFRARTQVIEYEISQGKDFFDATPLDCDLVICNPPWKEALRWLEKIVEVAGPQTPIVFICPVLFFIGYKSAPCRQYLESSATPVLHHITPLPSDTFVKVYCPGAILWLNLPQVRDVALVPSQALIRSNDVEPGGSPS